MNGMYLGIQWNLLSAYASAWKIFLLTAPHGVIEIVGILIAGAVGIMGVETSVLLYGSRLNELRLYARSIVYQILISLLLTCIAAIIEAHTISRIL